MRPQKGPSYEGLFAVFFRSAGRLLDWQDFEFRKRSAPRGRLCPCRFPIDDCRPRHCGPLSKNSSPGMAPTTRACRGASSSCCCNSAPGELNCISTRKPGHVTSWPRTKGRIPPRVTTRGLDKQPDVTTCPWFRVRVRKQIALRITGAVRRRLGFVARVVARSAKWVLDAAAFYQCWSTPAQPELPLMPMLTAPKLMPYVLAALAVPGSHQGSIMRMFSYSSS
jgi:hypothetical protein